MFLALVIAFLSPLIYAVSNIWDAQVSNHLFKKNGSLIFYVNITNLLVIPLVILWGGAEVFYLPKAAIFPLCMAAALEILYLLPYYIALKRMDTSIICALFSLSKILLPVLAWLMLDEHLHTRQYIGFFIVVGAALVLNLKKTTAFKIDLSFYLMGIASCMCVFGNIFSKQALMDMNWLAFTFYLIIFSDILVLLLFLIPSYRKEIIAEFPIFKRHLKLLLFMEVIDRAGSLTALFSLSVLPVVVKNAIGSTQPIFVLLYGFILYRLFGDRFKESLKKEDIIKKLVCFTFIIIGVILTIG